ncbi:MAG: hypothetical protein EPN21_16615 [Methylococcaceae bacterium]|nr:MAG: hypothetical protein EPN21_16615 [Methylococcaceae bacterium]
MTKATGAYTFTPNAVAINALGAAGYFGFSIRAYDEKNAALIDQRILPLNLTGVNEAPPVAPTAIALAATGLQNSTLNAGDVVSITVTMSQATTVNTTGGTPQLALTIGDAVVQASYASGSGSTALLFNYTIQAGQIDANAASASPPTH